MNFLKKCLESPTLMTWGNMLSQSAKLLVLTPLILIKYNVDEIAFWYLLLTINSLIIVLDFGFYPTFSRIISYAFNGLDSIKEIGDVKDTEPKKNISPSWNFMEQIYGTLNTIYFLMTAIVTIIVILTTYSSIAIIINRTNEFFVLWCSYFVFILSVVLAFLARRSDTIITGTNHVALVNRWNIFNNSANSVSSILIVYFGLGIEWLSLNQLFFSVLLVVRNYFMERYICDSRFKHFKMFKFDKEIFYWIWTPTWKSGILILASTGITQLTGIFYSKMSTSQELASYLITLKLVTTIAQFSQAPFYSKIPVFSGLRVNNQLGTLTKLSISSMYKALMVFVFGISGLFFCGDYLLKLIGANSKLESSSFLILMAFVWFFERNHAMHAQIYVTTNKIPFYKSAIITGVVSILLIYYLIPVVGVWAFPLAQGISNMVINNWWNVKLSVASLHQKFIPYFSKSALIPLLILIAFSFIKYLLDYYHLI